MDIKIKQEELNGSISNDFMSMDFKSDVKYFCAACPEKSVVQSWAYEGKEDQSNEIEIFKGGSMASHIFVSDDILMKRRICINESESLIAVKIILENHSEDVISIEKVIPLQFYGIQWRAEKALTRIFTQNRLKNGLPSVCTLGILNDNYKDTFGSLAETGQAKGSEYGDIAESINSDEFSIVNIESTTAKNYIILGFVPCMSQFVNCRMILDKNKEKITRIEMCCDAELINIEKNELFESEWVYLKVGDDPYKLIEDFTETKRKLSFDKPKEKAPSVYCSWYYYGDSVTENDVVYNLKKINDIRLPIDVFQIDEGWEERFGSWVPNSAFPSGMKTLADKIKAYGFKPGIWTSPFIIEPRCKLRYEHPEWILKKKDGGKYIFKMNEIDNLVLDITHPEVIEWIERLYRKLSSEWGFTYHKLDFTRAPVLCSDLSYHNKKLTRAQAYRGALSAVRKGTGESAYIVICGGNYSAASGLVQAHRTSSDVLSIWPRSDDTKSQTAPYTIKQNLLRYWMNSLWHNDPDALMVRRNKKIKRDLNLTLGLLNDEEAKVIALNQYWGGGILCFTEDMEAIDADRLALLRHIIPSIDSSAVPRDLFTENRFPAIIDTTVVPGSDDMDPWHTVDIVNWTGETMNADFVLNEYFLGGFAKKYDKFVVSEFWSGKIYENIKFGQNITFYDVLPHSSIHLRITGYVKNRPMLIYTNGHFSMGATEIKMYKYNKKRLDIEVLWEWEIPLILKFLAADHMSWEDGTKIRVIKINKPGRYKKSIKLS